MAFSLIFTLIIGPISDFPVQLIRQMPYSIMIVRMNGGLINLNKGYTEAPIYTNVNKTNDLKSTNIDILAEDLMIKGNEKLIGN